MKRIITFSLAIILLISLAIPVSAATKDTIQPRYTYINSVYAALSIDQSTGITTCTGSVTAKKNYPVEVVVRLQQDMGSYWYTLESWSTTGTISASLTENYAVYKGYEYRVYVTGYVYDSDGNIIESASGTHTVNYPDD